MECRILPFKIITLLKLHSTPDHGNQLLIRLPLHLPQALQLLLPHDPTTNLPRPRHPPRPHHQSIRSSFINLNLDRLLSLTRPVHIYLLQNDQILFRRETLLDQKRKQN